MLRSPLTVACALLTVGQVLAQAALEGTVRGADGQPLAYANLFLPDIGTGTSTDDDGAYYLRLPAAGDYRVAVSALGYRTTNDTLVIGDALVRYDFTLETSAAELDEIVVQASRRDPAYAIIRAASERRRERLTAIPSYRAEVYLKAREDVETFETPRQRRRRERRAAKGKDTEPEPVVTVSAAGASDELPFVGEDEAPKLDSATQALLDGLNLVESRLTLNYRAPRSYKEERHAYRVSGSDEGLLVPLFGDGDFDFYRTQVDFGSLAELKLTSPLAPAAVLNYKFELLGTRAETGPDGHSALVHEIGITPRQGGNAALEGRIWIDAEDYAIHRVDVVLPPGALRLLDELRFEQTYGLVADSVWLPTRQVFTYATDVGEKRRFEGRTTVRFGEYELGVAFPQDFFRGELAVTEAAAYERDSAYWNAARPEALAADEALVTRTRDSIRAVRSTPAYRDSLQRAFNAVRPLEVIWDGVAFRDWRREEQLSFGSLPGWFSFGVVGGFRFGPFVQYARTYPNGRRLSTSVSATVGFLDRDVWGSTRTAWRYAPHRFGTLWLDVDRGLESVNPNDAILNQLQRANYFLVNRGRLGHGLELRNGLYLDTEVGFAERLPATGSLSFLAEAIDDEAAPVFEPYETATAEVGLRFTPFQRYLTEPKRKVLLGSAWPTLRLRYKWGVPGVLGSDVDFGYVEGALSQNVLLGPLGNTRYEAKVGQFTRTTALPFIDRRRFPRSNPLLFSAPLASFQIIDTALVTTRPFFEVHALHHFSGAFLNNLPLIRWTGVEFVVGGGFMYLTEGEGYRHEEALAGVERVFKLGVRRRLRLGVYGVAANSSAFRAERTLKVSVDVIDTWKRDWSF